MAYIYKIINDINGKLYIGKTEFAIEKRWKVHIKDSKTERCKERPLYRAFNKYGIEHFHIELIEETNNPEEREKYWIEYYGSFKYGYNATKGGDGKKYLDYELIYKTYLETKSEIKTGQLCNCSDDTVRYILDIYKVSSEERKKNKIENRQKQVAQIDLKTGEIIEVFESAKKAQDKYPQTNKHISSVCKGKRKSCGGYGWKYI